MATLVEYSALLNLTDAPTSVPYRYGLFSAVNFDQIGEHDRLGMTWRSDACQQPGITIGECKAIPPAVVAPLVASACGYIGTAEAFTAYILDEDSLAGVPLSQHETQARNRFIAAEQWGVENQIAASLATAGAAAASIIDIAPLVHAQKSIPDKYQTMLAHVESQLSIVTGNEGIIYMSRFAASMLSTVLTTSGGMLRTVLGTPVAAMGGWPDVTANTLITEDVIYGTGPVKAARGDIDLYNGTGDLSVNDASIIVQRTYSFGWDCGVVGASVTL